MEGIAAAVGDNVIQFVDDTIATGTIPITGVRRLPMLLQSSIELAKAGEIVAPDLDAGYGKRGIVVRSHYSYPFQVVWRKKKITSWADISRPDLVRGDPGDGDDSVPHHYVRAAGSANRLPAVGALVARTNGMTPRR